MEVSKENNICVDLVLGPWIVSAIKIVQNEKRYNSVLYDRALEDTNSDKLSHIVKIINENEKTDPQSRFDQKLYLCSSS